MSVAELIWKLPVVETTRRTFPCRRCGKNIGRNCSICATCVLPHRLELRAQALYPARDSIDKDYRWAQFDSPLLAGRVGARAHVLAQARVLLTGSETVVTIVGQTGSGKTSLACAMLSGAIEAAADLDCDRDTLERAKCAHFADAYALSVARAQHKLGGGEPPELVRAKAASVLVLDELGRDERKTSDVAEVIRRRMAAGRPTIITTWQSQQEIKLAYDGGIARRLFQRGTLIPLTVAT